MIIKEGLDDVSLTIRKALNDDLTSILLSIYNEGITDRVATLETELKDYQYMKKWFDDHTGRFEVLVAELDGEVAGWASLNRYSPRKHMMVLPIFQFTLLDPNEAWE